MLIFHDPRSTTYGTSMRPEQPARLLATVPHLRATHPDWEWREPEPAADSDLLLAHTPAHLRRLHEPRDFDADTPYYAGIFDHARRSAGAALAVMKEALRLHRPSFSLMRPPGHHATAEQAMGFCYLNSIAIAALAAQRQLGADRVAVWDFDAHHGNGTEAILEGRSGFLFASVHQFPAYPGTGTATTATCRNWSILPHAPRADHMDALARSWDAIVGFRPDVVLVSAGFDAYAGDPITAMTLEVEDFATLGGWLRQADMPVGAMLEGGYSAELPSLIDAFLSAWVN